MNVNLYLVQDADRPMYVLATNWQHAVDRWKERVGKENGGFVPEEIADPSGVQLVAEMDDLILQPFSPEEV